MIDIIIPTIGRAHQLADVVQNIHAATLTEHRIVFAIERKDTASADAIAKLGECAVYNTGTANYAGALNTAYRAFRGEWIFTGADDLVFSHGWDSVALAAAGGWFQVIGTNDLLNAHVLKGYHSTHSLVRREYLDAVGGVVDEGPGSFYPECYDHNYCDTEFINTAKMRSRFRPCLDAVVEHLHVSTGKVEADETYLRSIRHYDDDARMYDMRMSLWSGISR